jgi:isopentenyl-diphosphate delta-isomerase
VNQRPLFPVKEFFFTPIALELSFLDPNAAGRKRDHIELAFRSQVAQLDDRFSYEPLLSAHPLPGSWPSFEFLGKTFRVPLWVSSMTGGTEWAGTINRNLARACGEFGFGMGLGSCRSLLDGDETLPDFDVRGLMGDDVPLFANLGIAQLERLVDERRLGAVRELVARLSADGLIVHVNPLQEWLQPEGDRFQRPPLETIRQVLEETGLPIIVKEVGQGMGPESLKALLQLPLAAVDFAAGGGTNFAKLELLRSDAAKQDQDTPLAHVGHSAGEMVRMANRLFEDLGPRVQCRQIIVSGGVQTYLDGYYWIRSLVCPAVYGQASAFLKHARGDYADLQAFVAGQIRGLELASAYLKPKAIG